VRRTPGNTVTGRVGVSRRGLLRGGLALGGAAILGGGVGAYAWLVEPRRLTVERVTVPLFSPSPARAGLRVAQLSDLHLGPLVPREAVRAAVDLAMSLRPDLVALTGDFVSRVDGGELAALTAELSRFRAPLGVFACLGNHDHWTDAAAVSDAVERAGVRLLRNASAAVDAGSARLYVAGVDDVWEEQDDLGRALAGVPEDGVVLLLAHEPDFADEAALDPRPRLQLSGHSHGGQVKLPGVPRVLPYLGRKYPEGLYQVDGPAGALSLYTTRGVGLVSPAVRLNCPPEVTLLEMPPA
jgi:predicted MPP superfamily phosphohydrolase